MTDEPTAASDTLKNQAEEHFKALEKKHKDGANWFFWIAGLSLVNSEKEHTR